MSYEGSAKKVTAALLDRIDQQVEEITQLRAALEDALPCLESYDPDVAVTAHKALKRIKEL